MMCFNISLSSLLILFLFFHCSIQGPDITNTNSTSTSASVDAATTTSSETSKPTVFSCPGGHINPPDCTKCATNSENKEGQCFEIKNEIKPSPSTSRRLFLIFIACLLTVSLFVAMFVVYGRYLNQQRRRRLSSNPVNTSNTNVNNRFHNILRSIGLNNLNKRGRFNFFSISNNNSSSGQYRQPETSRAQLNENPDEALLFDDPYADGGIHNSSANPYKSLTLAVT